MKSTGDRLERWEKAKWVTWDWIKGNVIDTNFFYTGG